MNSRKGRILFVSFFAPPMGGSHGKRVRSFFEYLAESGWEVDVLTASPSPGWPNYDPSLIDWRHDGVKIFRTFAGLTGIYYSLKKVSHPQPKFNAVPNARRMGTKPVSILSRLSGYAAHILASIPTAIARSLTIARTPIDWYPFAVCQGLRLAGKHRYDILISSSYDCHLIAYAIKKRTGLPWITDYGDPWAFNPHVNRNKIKFQIEYNAERRVLKLADAVVLTTEETKQDYLTHYPFLNEKKVVVIPMGADCDSYEEGAIERRDKFTVLYTGTIYQASRDAEPFLDAVKLFFEKHDRQQSIEILFAGSLDNQLKTSIARRQLCDRIQLLGFIPHDEIPGLLMGVDVLLFLGNQGGLQVPGKLFEYLAARRPILFIKGDEKDPSLRFLKELNRGIIVNNITEEIYQALVQFCDLYRTGTLDAAFNLAAVPGISWKERAETLSRLCMNLVSKKDGWRPNE